jgi:hypothetical protein
MKDSSGYHAGMGGYAFSKQGPFDYNNVNVKVGVEAIYLCVG